ncbi:hypothetical protein [Ruegeria lacuscaerulensis]|uniref:hypothetical protein n=1 Tax=Ruegeria lacuscaerulensis TaxID=55218 RepID=UPI001480A12E|nr:hypothetical protein [Ruegeria lacuscaerulensis]
MRDHFVVIFVQIIVEFTHSLAICGDLDHGADAMYLLVGRKARNQRGPAREAGSWTIYCDGTLEYLKICHGSRYRRY